MLSFILLLVLAIIAGWVEQLIMSQGFVSPPPRAIKGIISLSYHLPLWVSWGITCFLAGHFWAIGLFALVQDASWYFFNKKENLSEDDWVSMKWGGFKLPWNRQFIPWTYPLLILLSLILLFII